MPGSLGGQNGILSAERWRNNLCYKFIYRYRFIVGNIKKDYWKNFINVKLSASLPQENSSRSPMEKQ